MDEQLRVHPRLVEDLQEAFAYYDGISTELGDRFRLAIDSVLDEMYAAPLQLGSIAENVRFARVRRFPVGVAQEEDRSRLLSQATPTTMRPKPTRWPRQSRMAVAATREADKPEFHCAGGCR